jgi:hypothetical protein
LTVVPAAQVLAYTDGMACPGCKRMLEVSNASRHLATLAGLAAAALVWWRTGAGGTYGWVLPVVYSFLAFSMVAPVVLALLADLRNKPDEPVAAPVGAGGHGGHR